MHCFSNISLSLTKTDHPKSTGPTRYPCLDLAYLQTPLACQYHLWRRRNQFTTCLLQKSHIGSQETPCANTVSHSSSTQSSFHVLKSQAILHQSKTMWATLYNNKIEGYVCNVNVGDTNMGSYLSMCKSCFVPPNSSKCRGRTNKKKQKHSIWKNKKSAHIAFEKKKNHREPILVAIFSIMQFSPTTIKNYP